MVNITLAIIVFTSEKAISKYNAAIDAKLTDEKAKNLATSFFFHWYNAQGSNTLEGFDEWWKDNRNKFIKG